MHPKKLKLNNKVKKKYLQFIQSQEILSEPFRNKLGQLNKFFLPMSKKIYDHRIKNNKTIIVGNFKLKCLVIWKASNYEKGVVPKITKFGGWGLYLHTAL